MKYSGHLEIRYSDIERWKYFFPVQLTVLKVVIHSYLSTQSGSTCRQPPICNEYLHGLNVFSHTFLLPQTKHKRGISIMTNVFMPSKNKITVFP